MKINIYLNFPGTCEEALGFYHEVLGGELREFFRYRGTPMEGDVSPEWRDKIMHGSLDVGGLSLMGADMPPAQFVTPQGYQVSLNVDSIDDAEGLFAALGEGGKVTVPIEEVFWTKRFGMLTDRFGINWMVSSE